MVESKYIAVGMEDKVVQLMHTLGYEMCDSLQNSYVNPKFGPRCRLHCVNQICFMVLCGHYIAV